MSGLNAQNHEELHGRLMELVQEKLPEPGAGSLLLLWMLFVTVNIHTECKTQTRHLVFVRNGRDEIRGMLLRVLVTDDVQTQLMTFLNFVLEALDHEHNYDHDPVKPMRASLEFKVKTQPVPAPE